MGYDQARSTADLSPDERARLRRAHQNLRAASQELEALVATEPLRNRWAPEPAPPEILAAARAELLRTYEELTRCHEEILTAVAVPPARAATGAPAETDAGTLGGSGAG